MKETNKKNIKKLIYLNSNNKQIVLKNVLSKKLEVYNISQL